MPLRCLANGLDMVAYAFDATEFEHLRAENAHCAHLKMVCCESPVVLRTSPLGTRYFSHARKGDCTAATETSEHLLAKAQIAQAVVKAGWVAQTEASGQLPSGEAWAADVLATKAGEKPIVFEVQWARQSQERTAERTAAYASAGFTAVWLMRQNDLPCDSAAPAVRLISGDGDKHFGVALASAHYSPQEPSARSRDYEQNWRQRMSLEPFVDGVLAGRLRFGAPESPRTHLVVHGARIACWLCQKLTRLVVAIEVKHSLAAPGAADHRMTLSDFDHQTESRDFLMAALPPELLRPYGIGALKPRSSKMVGDTYLSNGCVHCDALQGRFFEHEASHEEAPIVSVEIDNPQMLRNLVAAGQAQRWWLFENPETAGTAQAASNAVQLTATKQPPARFRDSSARQIDMFEDASNYRPGPF